MAAETRGCTHLGRGVVLAAVPAHALVLGQRVLVAAQDNLLLPRACEHTPTHRPAKGPPRKGGSGSVLGGVIVARRPRPCAPAVHAGDWQPSTGTCAGSRPHAAATRSARRWTRQRKPGCAGAGAAAFCHVTRGGRRTIDDVLGVGLHTKATKRRAQTCCWFGDHVSTRLPIGLAEAVVTAFAPGACAANVHTNARKRVGVSPRHSPWLCTRWT